MKVCPYCAEEIQDAALLCRFCQRQRAAAASPDARAKDWTNNGFVYRVVLGFTGVIVLLILLGVWLGPRKPSPSVSAMASQSNVRAARDKQENAALLARLETTGLIVKRTCIGNETQVSLGIWRALNADQKQSVTRLLGAVCDDEGSGSRMTVIDAQSGRKLAEIKYGSYTVF